MNDTPPQITKIMSLTLDDFHRSVRALAPDLAISEGQTEVSVPHGNVAVPISYEALESETLGGLLALPRARVTLDLDGLNAAECALFLARFDQAFQRGGG